MSRKTLFLIQLLINLCLCYGLTDRTFEDKATGPDVVDAVIKKIKDWNIFPDDNGIMKRIAYVESKFGANEDTFRSGFFGGIWQIESIAFENITKHWDQYDKLTSELFDKINAAIGTDIREKISYEQLLKPLYSGLAARLRLFIIYENIPGRFDIGGQGDYWNRTLNRNKTSDSVKRFVDDVTKMENEFENTCRGRMDLAIVMDGSGSIGQRGFVLARTFVAKLVQTFSPDSVKVGLIVFSTGSKVVFPLDNNLNATEMNSTILNSNYPAGWTNTNLGIDDAVNILNNTNSKQNRQGIPKIMAIFTDGDPTCQDYQLEQSLEQARSNNITIFAIGIGTGVKTSNLYRMTNSWNRVFSMSSYDYLSKSFQLMNSETCKIPQKPVVGSNLTDVLVKHEKRYFHFHLPHIGITIKINIHLGNVKGYFSFSLLNPSYAMNDGEFTGQVFIPYKQPKSDRFKRDVYDNTQESNTTNVFIALEGTEKSNKYTFTSEQGDHVSGSNLIRINTFTVISSIIFYSITKLIIF